MGKDKMQDLFEEQFPKNSTDFSSEKIKEKIASFCSSLFDEELFTIAFPLSNLSLYRVRYHEAFDISDISQYGYIQDTSRIKRLRYNLPEEQVLYTATHPYVAYRETEYDGAPSHFFLSIWRKKAEFKDDFMVYPVFPSDWGTVKGTAAKYRKGMDSVYLKMPDKQKWAHSVGHYLEAPKTGWPNEDYILSSSMAHCILMGCDALLTVSQKSDDSELNITFNKSSADKIELSVIYRCKSLDYQRNQNQLVLFYHVDSIGIPKNGQIEWHSFRIIPSSIKPVVPINVQKTKEIEALAMHAEYAKQEYNKGNLPDRIKISVQQGINDFFHVCGFWGDLDVGFKAKIELI